MDLSIPSIQRHLDGLVSPQFKLIPRPIILVLDATYFGEKKAKDGLLVGKDWLTKEPVYYKFIETETKLVYFEARKYLADLGFEILAVVMDGRPGIRNVFKDLPLQMCQFHQIQIVNRYLTKKPKLLPSIQAVNSIKTNLPYLFTFQDKTITNIPNTTNSLDGWFAHLKKLLNCHNGLRKDRRNRVIEYILSAPDFN